MIAALLDVMRSDPGFAAFAFISLLGAVYIPLSDDRWAAGAYRYFQTAVGAFGWMLLHWLWLVPAIALVAIVNRPLLSALGTPLPRGAAYVLWGSYALLFFLIRFFALKFLRRRMERRIAVLRTTALLGAYVASTTEGDAGE
ncbi:hypothetical protein [Sphingomonas sp. LT1P40]|uniref:hypothetical protein n=1 Tax=Alteristakelama amylovorans TaxID=3096166 RepID=UPI002FC9A4CC